MAIKISNTTVIDDSRQLQNISNLKTINGESILGTGNITEVGPTGPEGPTGPRGPNGFPGNPGQPGFDGLGFDNTSSNTTHTISTGIKSFSTSNTGAYVIGTRVRVVATSSTFMEGTITNVAFNSSITVEVTNISGSGTFSVWKFTVAGLVGPAGPTGSPSDDRLKTRLGNIENALERVRNLNGFFYEANETAVALGHPVLREVGVSAQELLNQLPEVVIPGEIGLKNEVYWAVQYARISALLIEAIKELDTKIMETQNK
jgi:hypothetical protein